MQLPPEIYRNWTAVNTAMRPDMLPAEVSPHAMNNAFTQVSGGAAVPSKRRGFAVVNTTGITGTPEVLGMHQFWHREGGSLTSYHLLVSDGGRLDKLVSGAVSAADSSTSTPFTSGTYYPSFQTANNLEFIVNGVDKKKFNGSVVQNFGIAAPAAPSASASGTSGNPSGTYDIALSYFNSATGAESSRSDYASVTVSGKKISVSWSAPSDTQVDYVRLHIRKESLTAAFFLLTTGLSPSPDSTNEGYAVSITSATIDVTDDELKALFTSSPTTTENNPPLDGVEGLAFYNGRMFTHDKTNIYWSKVDFPEAFDPANTEAIAPNDGQDIVAIKVAFGILVIFKTRSMYGVYGDDPTTWQILPIDTAVGCVAKRSVVLSGGLAQTNANEWWVKDGYMYWWSESGPMEWDGQSAATNIGLTTLAAQLSPDYFNYSQQALVAAVVDKANMRVLFATPEVGHTRNTLILPWSLKNNAWESDGWNPFDIACMAQVEDSSNTPYVYVANYKGRVFQHWTLDTDGARVQDGSGNLFTLSGSVTGSTDSTLTDSTATFDTTGDGLAQLYVYAIDPTGVVAQRKLILSNTATVLTIDGVWDVDPTTDYTYTIASPDWNVDTKWSDFGMPFNNKRLLFGYVQGVSDSGSALLDVDLFTNYGDTPVATFSLNLQGAGALFDVATFDNSVFASPGVSSARSHMGEVGLNYKIRCRNRQANKQATLLLIQVTGTAWGDRGV